VTIAQSDASRPQRAARLRRVALRPDILTVLPSGLVLIVFVYGFILWSFVLSLTSSRIAPVYDFVGLQQYALLWANDRWIQSLLNLATFGIVFVTMATLVGLVQAVFLPSAACRDDFDLLQDDARH
jgi:glucose/mannose transport system permease protein